MWNICWSGLTPGRLRDVCEHSTADGRLPCSIPRDFDFGHEAISSARNGFDKARIFGRVVQSFPQLIDGIVQIVIKINKSIVLPQALVELVACDQSPRAFQEGHENLKGFFLQFDLETVATQFARFGVDLEGSEAQERAGGGWAQPQFPGAKVPENLPYGSYSTKFNFIYNDTKPRQINGFHRDVEMAAK
jgi:hypothetical protein